MGASWLTSSLPVLLTEAATASLSQGSSVPQIYHLTADTITLLHRLRLGMRSSVISHSFHWLLTRERHFLRRYLCGRMC